MSRKTEGPYSYHTFMYPFLWDNGGIIDQKTFLSALDEKLWIPDYVVSRQGKLNILSRSNEDWKQDHQNLEKYRSFQYFNSATRKALFQDLDSDKDELPIVDCRQLILGKEEETVCQYVIHLENEITYTLGVNAVRLRIYNTGVAVIIFELEYHPQDRSQEQKRNDVLLINEYGRRLFPEFIPVPSRSGFLLAAEKLELRWQGSEKSILDDFRSLCIDGTYLKEPTRIPNIIHGLLEWGNEPRTKHFTSNRAESLQNKNQLYIKPAIDSRMFVCCCILDSEYPNRFLWDSSSEAQENTKRDSSNWRFRTNWDAAQELYALLNIDTNPAYSTCQSRQDLDKYLNDQLYTRWLEYGTIHGVTNHSMICVTSPSSKVIAAVVNPFLTLYTQMAMLVLVQRASLISFDEKVTDLAATGLKTGNDQQMLSEVQRRFTLFQGQLLLAEVTPQIQGIELYRKLQEMLFINELEQNVQSQTANLFEVVEAKQGNRLNSGGLLLAVAALALTLWQAREIFIDVDTDWLPTQWSEFLAALGFTIFWPLIIWSGQKLFHLVKKRIRRARRKQGGA